MPTGKRNGDDLPKDGVLRPKHERFVLEYLKDLNASAAARRAGYSVRNSNVVGRRLLANVHISAAIERAKAERLERVRIDGDKVLRGFACLAFSDPGDYLTWGPDGARLKPSEDLTQDQRMAVSEVSEIVTTTDRTSASSSGTGRVRSIRSRDTWASLKRAASIRRACGQSWTAS